MSLTERRIDFTGSLLDIIEFLKSSICSFLYFSAEIIVLAIVDTAWDGYFPIAASADNITVSAPWKIAVAISLISVFTGIPVKANTAMTGEITLRGQILKIGGLKEKLLAAKRGGIKNVIIPKENEPDLQEIPKQITKSLNIIPVEWIDEVISAALIDEPTPLSKKIKGQKSKAPRKSENKQAH